jgi:hypothetical protein
MMKYNLLIATILSTLSLLFVVLLSQYPMILFFVLCILVILIDRIYPRPALFYICCAIGGGIAESIGIHFGLRTWTYAEPTSPLNIPLWILPIWANAAVFMVGLGQLLGPN